MITRRDRLIVGIFVVATTAILIATLGILWGIQASKPYKRYYVVTDSSVSGLSPSAVVKYLGVDTGKVEKMTIDDSVPPKVRLTIAVTLDTPIKKDTKAQLQPVGITGLQIIELVRGESSEDLEPGSEIPYLPSKLTDIVTKIDRVSGALDLFLGENREKISHVIDAAHGFLETTTAAVVSAQQTIGRVGDDVHGLIDENRKDLREAIASTRSTLDEVARLTKSVNDKRTVEELTAAVADVRRAVAELEGTVRDLRAQLGPTAVSDAIADVRSTARSATDAAVAANALLGRVGGRLEDDLEATGRVLDQLVRTARGLEELSREIKERPSLLLRDLERNRREVPDK